MENEKPEWEKVKEIYPDLDDFEIAEIVKELLPGEKIGYDYYKRCRAQSVILRDCDYGIDEEAQDRILGQDPEEDNK